MPDSESTTATDADRQALEARLAALHRICTVIDSALDLDTILVRIMSELKSILDVERATLYLVDRETEEVWSKVLQEGETLKEIRIDLGQGIAGWVAKEGKPVNLADVYNDSRFDDTFDQVTGFRTHSILCHPVFDSRGAVIGALQVINRKDGGPFRETDTKLVETIVPSVGIAIENATLYQSLLERNRALHEAHRMLQARMDELDLLFRLEKIISEKHLPREEFIDSLLREAATTLKAETLMAVFQGPRTTEAFIARPATSSDVERRHTFSVSGLVAKVLQTGRPMAVGSADLAEEAGEPLNAFLQANTEIIVQPMPKEAFGNEATEYDGVIVLLLDSSEDWNLEGIIKLLTLVAAQLASGLRSISDQQQARHADRLMTIGQMLSGILHDFQTPMMITRGFSELLAGELAADDRARYAQTIARQVQHMGDMVGEVLAFAKGERQLLRSHVFVRPYMEELAEIIRMEFNNLGVALNMDIDFDGKVFLDPIKIKRAIFNLARNAGQILEGRDNAQFRISVVGEGDDLVMRFTDNGPGVPTDVLNSLFEMFVSDKQRGGTGLGLAIVHDVVASHKGHVDVDSKPGTGTTFTVSLPIGQNGAGDA